MPLVYVSRYLNVAQNKIEKLPPSGDRVAVASPARKLKSGKGMAMPERWGYTALVLEEVYLQVCQICEQSNCTIIVLSFVLYRLVFNF
jgi:hypothetical protein